MMAHVMDEMMAATMGIVRAVLTDFGWDLMLAETMAKWMVGLLAVVWVGG